jgi:hypothetical protein
MILHPETRAWIEEQLGIIHAESLSEATA